MEKNESQGELNALHENQQNDPILIDVPMMNYITYCGVGHPSDQGKILEWQLQHCPSWLILSRSML